MGSDSSSGWLSNGAMHRSLLQGFFQLGSAATSVFSFPLTSVFGLFFSENNWLNAPVCFGAESNNTAQSTSADANDHTKGLHSP